MTTLLVISGAGVSPYSARGLTQSLTPIDAASKVRRTINGVLLDVADPAFRKYKSTISCSDQDAPALDGYWPGMTVTVDCVAELSYKTAGGAAMRTKIAGSDRVSGDYTIYRPRLVMMVVALNTVKDEYGATTSWTMDLEEVG